MNVRALTPRLFMPPQAAEPASAPPPATADGFAPSAPAEDGSEALRKAARALTRTGELQKADSKYHPVAFARDADGQVYIGYSESHPGRKSYLSSVAPDGRIAWELPLGERKVTHVAVSGAGVLVGTSDGHATCSKDGHLQESVGGGPEIRSHHQDAQGMRLEVLGSDGTLRAFAPDGSPRELPPELTGLRARSVEATPDGGLFVFSDKQMVRLAPGGASAASVPIPAWGPDGKLTFSPFKAWPLEGGDVLVHRHSYMTMNTRGHMMGRSGFGGGYFDPDHFVPDTITRSAFVRLAPDGTERWRTDEMPEQTRTVVGSDGTVLLQNGTSSVQRIGPDGKFEVAFQVSGDIQDFRPGSTPGTVLIQHEDRVTRYDATGRTLGEVALGSHREKQIEADLPDGRILFREGFQGELWAADPATGAWVRMNDDADHSLRAEEVTGGGAPEDPAARVEETEEWVVIGDVQLPKAR